MDEELEALILELAAANRLIWQLRCERRKACTKTYGGLARQEEGLRISRANLINAIDLRYFEILNRLDASTDIVRLLDIAAQAMDIAVRAAEVNFAVVSSVGAREPVTPLLTLGRLIDQASIAALRLARQTSTPGTKAAARRLDSIHRAMVDYIRAGDSMEALPPIIKNFD